MYNLLKGYSTATLRQFLQKYGPVSDIELSVRGDGCFMSDVSVACNILNDSRHASNPFSFCIQILAAAIELKTTSTDPFLSQLCEF